MILSILRSIGSVIAGLAVATAFFVVGEIYSEFVYPFPKGYDPKDFMEVCKAHVAKYPTVVLAGGAAIWALMPLGGSWLATRLGTGRHPAHGYVVGAVVFAMCAMNMLMLPYPIWFETVIFLTFPLLTYVGAMLAGGPATNPGPAAGKASA